MNKPIRVLQVLTIMNRGGAETMVMNYYRHIDRSKIQFDFLLHRQDRGAYDDEIETMGGRIFRIPPVFNFFAHQKAVKRFFHDHPEYKIIHGHVGELGYCIYREANRRGVSTIIAHAHNSSCDQNWKWPIRTVLKKLIRPYINTPMTCGEESASWLFGRNLARKAIMLNNAIDANLFSFDALKREKVRNQMGWNNHFVICNVSRFAPPKNHKFLLSVFKAALHIRPESILALVGAKDGLYKEIKRAGEDMGLADKIQFLGARTDVYDILQGADVFCFPSKYEGFGIVMLEAQAAGLRTVKSDGVENDGVLIPDLVETCSLHALEATWAQSLCKPYQRKNTCEAISAAGFDIQTNAVWLQSFYLSQHHSK